MAFDVVLHPPQNGAMNMQWDIQRAELLTHDIQSSASFRLYSWSPWCVSLGYHQREEEIDHALCDKYGWDIVRRPTGGKAVLHADELTYSLIMPLTTMNQHEVYRLSHEFLRLLLCSLLPKEEHEHLIFSASHAEFAHEYRHSTMAEVCFARSAQFELSWHGRKLVGSAQRLLQGEHGTVLLQHGSIPLSPAHTRLAEILVLPEHTRKEVQKNLMQKAVSLQEIAHRSVSVEEFFTV